MSYHQDDGGKRVDHDPKGCPMVAIPLPIWVAWYLLSPRRRAHVRRLRDA
jgi:hypothetical protein